MQMLVARDGQELGTFSLEEVNERIATGTLFLTDVAWHEGLSKWKPLSKVQGVYGPKPSSSSGQGALVALGRAIGLFFRAIFQLFVNSFRLLAAWLSVPLIALARLFGSLARSAEQASKRMEAKLEEEEGKLEEDQAKLE